MTLYIHTICFNRKYNRRVACSLPKDVDLSKIFLMCDLNGGKARLNDHFPRMDDGCFEAFIMIIQNAVRELGYVRCSEDEDPKVDDRHIPDGYIKEIRCGFDDTGYMYRYVEDRHKSYPNQKPWNYEVDGVSHTMEKIDGRNKV